MSHTNSTLLSQIVTYSDSEEEIDYNYGINKKILSEPSNTPKLKSEISGTDSPNSAHQSYTPKINNSTASDRSIERSYTPKLINGIVPYLNDNIYSDSEEDDSTSTSSTVTLPTPIEDPSPKSNSSENDDEFEQLLPPKTNIPYPDDAQEKINKLLKQSELGLDIREYIQQRKEFRNPSMYTKLIEHCGIDEFGTNYSPSQFDPYKWGKESYYDELSNQQQIYHRNLGKKNIINPTKVVPIQIVTGVSIKSSLPNAISNETVYSKTSSISSTINDRKKKLNLQ